MTVINFPMSYIYGIATFGFVLMTFRFIQVAIRHQQQGWSSFERSREIEN
jgi:TRAP-type C4-dicarboxylate transport system permease small subunit